MKTLPVYWLQNIQQHYAEPLNLTAVYDTKHYPAYDNYDAIEVSKTKDIPNDYFGVMGVPLRYIAKHNPQQFEIVGCAYSGYGRPFIDGKVKYARLLVRRKH